MNRLACRRRAGVRWRGRACVPRRARTRHVVQIGFALVATPETDKVPNGWGRKYVVTNPTGLKWSVSTITAGNTALELAVAMDVVRRDRSLADIKWGSAVPLRKDRRNWCAPRMRCHTSVTGCFRYVTAVQVRAGTQQRAPLQPVRV